MSAVVQYTAEDKKKAFADCVNYVRSKQEEAEGVMRNIDGAYETWKPTREDTICEIARLAECIKSLTDDMVPVQTICKAVSAGGKIAVLGGPVAAAVGTGTSIIANIGYGACSKYKQDELEILCKDVRLTLERDGDATHRLCRYIGKFSKIHDDVVACVRTFYSATTKGLFDDVRGLQRFADGIRNIQNIHDLGGVKKFLEILWDTAQTSIQDADLLASFSNLGKYNPSIMELVLLVPEIILECAIFCSALSAAGVGAVSINGVFKGLALVSAALDIVDIYRKLRNSDEYPELSKKLFEIKQKLEEERDSIDKMKGEMGFISRRV